MSFTAVRRGLIVATTLAWLGVAGPGLAGPPEASFVATVGLRSDGPCLPVSLAAYPSKDAARALHSEIAGSGSAGRSLLPPPAAGDRSLLLPEEPKGNSRKYLPMLYSLLIPGTGELALGYYVRGALLLGAEVTAWTGYIHYHNQGIDSREDYENFADEHWDYDKWIDDHLATQDLPEAERTFEALDSIGRNYWNEWPGYHTWHSKEEEKQNYYENIGKYDWFISGWEDWDPLTAAHDTDLRDTYRAMRRESNDQLDKADKFIYLSIAARVCSLVDTYFLVRKQSEGSSGAEVKPGFSIDAHATGFASGQVALVYNFR